MPPNSEAIPLSAAPVSANHSHLGLFPATSIMGRGNRQTNADRVALQIPLFEGILRDIEITRRPEA